MLREILEKVKNEMLCSEAKAIAKKLSSLSGMVTIKCKSKGLLYSVDSDDSVIGGYITAKDKKGKRVELNLCGNKDYEVQ